MQSNNDADHEQATFDQVATLIRDGKNAEAMSILQTSNLHQKTSTPENLTLLHVAAEAGNKEMAGHLIGLGSDVEAKTAAGLTPLTLAVENKRKSVVETLIWAGNCKYDYIDAMSKIPTINDKKSDEYWIYHTIFMKETGDWTDKWLKTTDIQSFVNCMKKNTQIRLLKCPTIKFLHIILSHILT